MKMSEENKELSPDELMAQQFGDLANEENEEEESIEPSDDAESETTAETSEETPQELSPDELMAQQFAQQSYASPQEESAVSTFTEGYEKSDENKLAMLLDIPLEVTIEVGSTQMPIEDILKLNPNSVIELDRYINEPVDLKVNGKTIAKGELHTVKNNFGIKITHIITPEDRLKILDT